MRGGVSFAPFGASPSSRFSPRAWRCFALLPRLRLRLLVFSTCVEVFPTRRGQSWRSKRFLHVRGGVSRLGSSAFRILSFSPRAWRCFWYSEQICNKECGFLHVRGGVSMDIKTLAVSPRFSPRAWRCFYVVFPFSKTLSVFSTCVEVFLPSWC